MTATALQQAGQGAPAHGAEGGAPDLGGTLMHHIMDAHEIELPLGIATWPLPEWEPLHLGPLAIDVSPTKHVVFLLLAAAICAIVFTLVGRSLRRRDPNRAPSGFANAIEALVLYLRDEVVRRNIGEGADKYASYILTLFFFILTMNLLGLVPWGASATGNISVTAALAIVTFVVVEVSGFRALGPAGYARTIFFVPHGIPGWMKPVMLAVMIPVELVSKLTKPFALAVRLFANMTAGHTLILSLLGLIFIFAQLTFGKWAVAGASVGATTAMMVLELFVAFLQAYIFAMLTAVFIGLIRHAH
jgi:F-type H+-transporting ATPase subunit a